MSVGGLAGITSRQLDTLRNGLRIMALRALGNADAAEDAVQETLLRALSAVTAEIASDDVRLGAFLGGIARHVITDMKRRDLRFMPLTEKDEKSVEPNALNGLLEADERAAVSQALAELAPADRELLHASFFDGLSAAEIAERLDSSADTIRKRKSRALARLRRVFEQMRHDQPASTSNRQIRLAVPAESSR